MKYPYWKIAPENPRDPWIMRPIVHITLHGPKRSLTIGALLDSGADHSLFRTDVAEALGIDLSLCEKRMVAGIEAVPEKSFLTKLPVTPEHLPTVTIPILFWERQPIAIIGQTGFFDLHKIKFERDHNIFEITPISKKRRVVSG